MITPAGGSIHGERARDGLVLAVLAGCDGAARGFLVAIALTFGSMLGAVGGLLAWSALTGTEPTRSGTVADILLALAAGVPIAYVASWRTTRSLAAHEGRPGLAAPWLVGGAGVLALSLLFMFVVRITLLPGMLLAEAAVLAAWIVGAALAGLGTIVRLTTRRWLAASLLLAVGLLLAWGSAGVRPDGGGYRERPERNLGLVGASLDPAGEPPVGLEVIREDGRLEVELYPGEGDGRRWSDLRLELWAALPRESSWSFADDLVGDPDPAVAGPIRVVPLGTDDSSRRGSIRYDDVRGLRQGLVVLTSVADGERYVLHETAVVADYRATPWEWLRSLAPGSPGVVRPVTP